MPEYYLKCTSCGAKYGPEHAWPRCDRCGGILEVVYERLELPRDFRTRFIKQWKYAPLMPVSSRRPVTAGEGGTRLRKVGSEPDVYLKIEIDNPTKSFKDRGSAVELTKALELGFKRVVVASTGNMALSVSAYSEIAGVESVTFVGSNSNRNKVDMIRNKGGRIVEVEGDFNVALVEAEKFARSSGSFLVGDYMYRKEGQKGVFFEIIDQLNFNPPDYVFVPIGNGTLISAAHKAFKEYRELGLIDGMPRIIGVQARGAGPIYNYVKTGRLRRVKVRTRADAIAVGLPTYARQAKEAVEDTGGDVVLVNDREMLSASREIYKKAGVCPELAGAAAYAALRKFNLSKDEVAVAIVSGGNI